MNQVNKESNKSIATDPEVGGAKKAKSGAFTVLFRIFVQAFSMTFVAEWGDRSQITTIILSARENLMGVITGGIIGHAICTGLGVLGGRMIAQKISVRTGKIIFFIYFKEQNLFLFFENLKIFYHKSEFFFLTFHRKSLTFLQNLFS